MEGAPASALPAMLASEITAILSMGSVAHSRQVGSIAPYRGGMELEEALLSVKK